MPVIDSVRTALRSLPRGMVHVGVGLVVLGLSTYGFLLVSAHAVTPQQFASLSVLYVLVYTVGPGVFLPFEQEVARALSDRRARGQGGGPLLRRAVQLSSIVAVGLVLLAAAFEHVLTARLFDDAVVLFLGLLLSIVGLWAAYVSRGVFAGNDQFGVYGAQLAIEGGSRFAACVVLAAAGVHAVGPYGVVLGGAFLVSVIATAGPLRKLPRGGPEAPWDELTATIGWLIVGAVLSLGLVNAGPVAVKLLAEHADRAAAGQLLAGLVLARLPLFVFAAVQAALLPSLAADLANGRLARFTGGLKRLVLVVGALTGVMAVLLALVGPAIMRVLFGPAYHLGRLDLAVLSIATGVYMEATVLGNGLLALQRFGLGALGWTLGVVVFAGVIAAPLPLFARVEYSFLAGVTVTALAFAMLLRHAMRHRRPSAPGPVPLTEVVPGT